MIMNTAFYICLISWCTLKYVFNSSPSKDIQMAQACLFFSTVSFSLCFSDFDTTPQQHTSPSTLGPYGTE